MIYVAVFVVLALLLAAWFAPAPSPRPRQLQALRCPYPPMPLWRGEARGWAGGRL